MGQITPPRDARDLARQLADVRRRLDILERSAPSTTVVSGDGALVDDGGTTVVAVDSSGVGLARPYISLTAVRQSLLTSPETTTSGTFATLYRVHGTRQHPTMRVHIYTVTGAGTTGELKVAHSYDGRTSATVSLPAATSAYQVIDVDLSLDPWGTVEYWDVQARRVAGANTVGITVVHVEGRGTI